MAYRNIPLDIRQEFGESMSEVIKGFARMGYSMTATAQGMGISRCAIGRWVRRLGLRYLFERANYNEMCCPKGRGWPKGKPRVKVQRWTDDQILASVAAHPVSFYAYRELGGLPSGETVIRRFGSWNNAKIKAKEMLVYEEKHFR